MSLLPIAVRNITHEAYELLCSRARAGVPAQHQSDGSWNVPFLQNTIDGIEANTQAGESFSDTLIRLIRRSPS